MADHRLEKARELYSLYLKDDLDEGNNAPEPIVWLHNKKNLKTSFKEFNNSLKNSPPILKSSLTNNSFYRYMEYMTNTF
tara:strand:- start:25 stop:261 length:237 start_codon:yes stop_codon:yes gene_type:complete